MSNRELREARFVNEWGRIKKAIHIIGIRIKTGRRPVVPSIKTAILPFVQMVSDDLRVINIRESWCSD